MNTKPIIKRTTAGTPVFMFLIKEPNHKLWIELKEDQENTIADNIYNNFLFLSIFIPRSAKNSVTLIHLTPFFAETPGILFGLSLLSFVINTHW